MCIKEERYGIMSGRCGVHKCHKFVHISTMGQRTHLDVTPRWTAGTPLHSLMAETRSDCLEQFSTYPLLVAMPGMLMEREASQYNISIYYYYYISVTRGLLKAIISKSGDVKKYHDG